MEGVEDPQRQVDQTDGQALVGPAAAVEGVEVSVATGQTQKAIVLFDYFPFIFF